MLKGVRFKISTKGKLILGQWQQVVLIDFDNRPRQREIIIVSVPLNIPDGVPPAIKIMKE